MSNTSQSVGDMRSLTIPRFTRSSLFLLSTFLLLASALAWAIVIWGSMRGIDLTDEGYYLNSISNPFEYKSSYSQFGFLFHPLYVLAQGSIILLRLTGVVLLTLAAVGLAWTVLRLPMINPGFPRQAKIIVTTSLSCTVLQYYFQWLPTPSYNLLALLGALICVTGWLLIVSLWENVAPPTSHRSVVILIFAFGLAITALAKPTTAAVLGLGIGAVTLLCDRRILVDVFIAGILSILLFSLAMLAIDGDASAAIFRYRSAFIDNQVVQSGHDLNSLVTSLGYLGSKSAAIVLVGLGAAYFFLDMDRRRLAVLAVLTLAPFAIAFGTNTDARSMAARASIFWISAGVLLVSVVLPRRVRVLTLYVGMSLAIVFVCSNLLRAVDHPYRVSGPLKQQNEWISSAFHQYELKVDRDTADYFRPMLAGAKAAEFKTGTPIIDMTGMGPTTIHMLGGVAPGLAWLPAGYGGSRDLATRALSLVSADMLRRSWVLTAIADSKNETLPLDILTDLGLEFPDGYEEVVRSRTSVFNQIHILWKPRIKPSPDRNPPRQ